MMKKEYKLSDSAAKKHMAHFMKLLVTAAIMTAAVLFLGLKRWSTAQYVWVNILLLGAAVFCVNALVHFGGRFDGKENQAARSKQFLIFSAVAAAVIWLLVTITGTSFMFSVLIFIAVLFLTIRLVTRTWEMLKNAWKMLGRDINENGDNITYPGQYVLHEVHTSDALTSPFGKVLIYEAAVLFVLPEMNNGFVLVNPNGTVELKKTALMKNELKENKLSVSTIMSQADEGAKHVMQLVEDVCKKNQIPVPAFNYNYVLFLPNFEAENLTWDQASFERLPSVTFWRADKQYKEYLENASKVDYFEGRACYRTSELQQMLKTMAGQSGTHVDKHSKEIIAEGIAQACGLKLSEPV